MSQTIFIVEDEISIRDMYALAFTAKGYSVDSATNGREALEKLLNPATTVDLILLDIMIPLINGLEVLKELKKPHSPHRDVPVFLLTNLAQEDVLEKAITDGAEQYFIKSNILPRQLVAEVESRLNQPS